jgi:hypothetical protein
MSSSAAPAGRPTISPTKPDPSALPATATNGHLYFPVRAEWNVGGPPRASVDKRVDQAAGRNRIDGNQLSDFVWKWETGQVGRLSQGAAA